MPSHEAFMAAFNADQNQHHYEIVDHLGSGGFSEVYLATDSAHGATVALKFIKLDESTHLTERAQLDAFSKEARRVRALRHDNIVAVHWFDTHEQGDKRYPYLVMDHVDGGTLGNRREMRGGRLPAEEAVSLLGQVMLGVQHAHAKGILHRDLKPDNILIATDQEVAQISGFPDMTPYGAAKVTDFGAGTTAHTNRHTVTEKQQVIGTQRYMAPEHYEGEAVRASDVYSLAVILYEQLSGKQPIGSEHLTSVQWYPAHKSQNPVPLETAMAGHMDHLIEAIRGPIMRGLAKEVKDRYLTMDDFFEDFAQQVRAGMARMQRGGVTIDMGAPTVVNAPQVPLGVQPGAITKEPQSPDILPMVVPDVPPGHPTHALTKAGATPDLTREIPKKHRLLSRRSLLVMGGLAAVGAGGYAAFELLPRSDEQLEQERQAIGGVAKEVLGQLHKDGKLEQMFKLMGYLIPYDAPFVAKRLLAFRDKKELSWPVVGKLSFYHPEAAEKEIRAWMDSGWVDLPPLAATPFAAIAAIPGHPDAEIAKRTRDYVISGLATQDFWSSYHMMYAVSEKKSVLNTDTGKMTTGEEIWRELVDDATYSYDKLNAISLAATPFNSSLLTEYAKTYAAWLSDSRAGGIAVDIFRHAYKGLAKVNPRAVSNQLEIMADPKSYIPNELVDELAPELAMELAPYDPDAAARYVRGHRHLENASGLVSLALASSRPDVIREVIDKTGETLNSWMRLALNPLDENAAETAVSQLTRDRVLLAQSGAQYAAALLLSRTSRA
jgi:serine/threonine protein kinase